MTSNRNGWNGGEHFVKHTRRHDDNVASLGIYQEPVRFLTIKTIRFWHRIQVWFCGSMELSTVGVRTVTFGPENHPKFEATERLNPC